MSLILPPARLHVVFERADRTFMPGDVVRGRVDVEATSAFASERLVVGLHWSTRGKGHPDGEAREEIVHLGESFAPGVRSFPFAIALDPHASRTYRGALVSLDWQLRARLEVPHAIDPTAAEAIVVVAPAHPPRLGPDDDALAPLVVHSPDTTEPAFERVRGGVTMSSGVSAVLGAVIALAAIAWLVEMTRDGDSHLMIFAAAMALFGAYMLVTSVSRLWTRAAVRRLEVYVGPGSAPPIFSRGMPVACVARVATSGRARVQKVVFAVLARESAVYTRDGSERTDTHDHVWQTCEVVDPHSGRAPEAAYRDAPDALARAFESLPPPEHGCEEYRAVLAIPEGAQPTFASRSNSVRWRVRVLVALRSAPDWDETYEIYERM